VTTIAERVAAGAAFLDEHDPDWWKRIDLASLNLRSTCHCVLGQLYPDPDDPDESFETATLQLGLSGAVIEASGFDLPFPEIAEGHYHDLTAEWKRVITARREAAS